MTSEEIKEHIREIPDFPKPGINFKDITPLLADSAVRDGVEQQLINSMNELGSIDAIAGIESRGFFWGYGLAKSLGVPFIPIRKKGKLPYKTVSESYDLEYGSAEIEMHEDAVNKGWNIVIHDDLLATGGTANAAGRLIKKSGANVIAFLFLIELSFLNGREHLNSHTDTTISLIKY